MYNVHAALSDAVQLIYKSEFESAAREAFVTVENYLKKKSGLDAHGFDLATRALSFEVDKQTCAIKRAPLIAINGLKNESERNEQDGIRYMLMGFFQGPRNLYQDNHIGSGVSNTISVIIEASFFLHLLDGRSITQNGRWITKKVDYREIYQKVPTIASQLHIIGDDTEHLIANAWNSQWDCVLLGALFNHNAMCNLQSDQPIEQIAKAEYIHITNYELRALLSDIYNISEEDELWLEKYYKTAYKLLEKDSFQTAVHTMASYRWHSVPRVQLAVIWSGIESLFNVNTEVSFRISLYIANFLGENEAQAQQIFKQVRKIYSSRSSAVHGNKTKDNLESAVEESANLLTRILRRCAELNKLPDVDNLAFRVDKQKQGIKCKILVP